jgi:hypothetical protein
MGRGHFFVLHSCSVSQTSCIHICGFLQNSDESLGEPRGDEAALMVQRVAKPVGNKIFN